jgi:hypothetical protein
MRNRLKQLVILFGCLPSPAHPHLRQHIRMLLMRKHFHFVCIAKVP